MSDALTRFLVARTGRPFAWGVDDCALMVADWWRDRHGIDPAAALRGTYASADEKRAVVEAAGGLAALVGRLAEAAGAMPAGDPGRGDFGVIRVGGHEAAGIMSSDRYWAVRAPDGVSFWRSPDVLTAWGIGD